MGKQEEERLEMTNGGMEGGRPGREVSPAGAQDVPEIGGKGKGLGILHTDSMLPCVSSLNELL